LDFRNSQAGSGSVGIQIWTKKLLNYAYFLKVGTSAINSYVCIITAEVLTKIAYAHRWHEMPGMFASVSSKKSRYDVTKKNWEEATENFKNIRGFHFLCSIQMYHL
jgi:hypothetical protein